jgi:hypothetical protein
MRLVPVLPFFVANLLPALIWACGARFRLDDLRRHHPGGLVYTWVGAGLGEVFARGETPNLGIIFEPHILARSWAWRRWRAAGVLRPLRKGLIDGRSRPISASSARARAG